MAEILKKFKKFEANVEDLKKVYGEDLHNIQQKGLESVSADDVIYAIKLYIRGAISEQALLDWVNVLWFTDLYEYDEKNEDSIASVMSLLETIDEKDTDFDAKEYNRMIDALTKNENCELI